MYVSLYISSYLYILLYSVAWMKFLEVYINEPAVNKSVRQIQYLASTISFDNKIAWLLKAITFTDLTTLSGDDTSGHVEELCKKVH